MENMGGYMGDGSAGSLQELKSTSMSSSAEESESSQSASASSSEPVLEIGDMIMSWLLRRWW